jgi:hypothetical protein
MFAVFEVKDRPARAVAIANQYTVCYRWDPMVPPISEWMWPIRVCPSPSRRRLSRTWFRQLEQAFP